jgi:glyoxylase-like metal-dependent hydrolase (beta-lactamase superfamily II)
MDVEVARGIRRLSQGVVNFYLIEDGGRFTLVDAGTPRDWDLLVPTLAALGRSLDDLEAVVLTHAHSDHTGFAERARTDAGAAIWIHGADEAVAKGAKPPKNAAGVGRYLWRIEAYRTLISLSRRGGAKIVPIAEVSTFADGEIIDVPGRPRTVHTPGHTAGSSAILLEDRRAVLTGDVVVMRNPLTGRTGPQIMPSGLNLDSRQALGSLDAVERLPADLVLPGHGDPWTAGAAEAARAARAAGPS